MTDLCKEINEFGKGIGNKSRYRILEALLKGRKTVGELVGMVTAFPTGSLTAFKNSSRERPGCRRTARSGGVVFSQYGILARSFEEFIGSSEKEKKTFLSVVQS